MDIKEVQKHQQQQKDAKRETDFKWDDMSGGKGQSQATQSSATKKDSQQDKKVTSKDGISFAKGYKPTFKRSENVGNKSDFPELGNQQPEPVQQTKANFSGTIGQISSAPAQKKTHNQFESLKEEDTKTERKPQGFFRSGPKTHTHTQEETKVEEKPQEESGEPKQRPKYNFGGLKKNLQENVEENKEANKGLEEYQEKLKKEIKIHEAKKPREDKPFVKEQEPEEENEFEEVTGEKREHATRGRGGRGRGGERGSGRGGHTGFNRDE